MTVPVFLGGADGKVTLESTVDRGDGPRQWGLADPDGFVITVRTRACEDLGEQTLTSDGTWTVVITTADDGGHRYGFTVARK